MEKRTNKYILKNNGKAAAILDIYADPFNVCLGAAELVNRSELPEEVAKMLSAGLQLEDAVYLWFRERTVLMHGQYGMTDEEITERLKLDPISGFGRLRSMENIIALLERYRLAGDGFSVEPEAPVVYYFPRFPGWHTVLTHAPEGGNADALNA